MNERALRRALLCLALAWPTFVVCMRHEVSQYEQYHEHELTLACAAGGPEPAENVVLAVGNTSLTSAARSCLDTVPDADQVPAAELTSGGATLRFGSASEPGTAKGLTLLVTCSYDIGTTLAVPATCTGSATWNLVAGLLTGGVVDAPLTVVAEKRTSGPVAEAFDASVHVVCDGTPPQEVTVATDGVPNNALLLGATDVSCTVAVEIDSAASSAGQSVHVVVVHLGAASSDACKSDADCEGGYRCSSASLTCGSGALGTSCFSPYDPETGQGDCGPEAPVCGPIGTCHDGRDSRICGSSGGQSDAYCADGYECVGEGYAARCQLIP